MNTQITPASELQAKIEAKRYDYYTLPILEVTIKYRKPDLLKLSFNKQLPSLMADMVIKSYREAIDGADMKQYQEDLQKHKIAADDALVKSLGEKSYQLLSELVVSHKFLDVPESDFNAEPVPLISWNDVPEQDAIAFLFNLLNVQEVNTVEGAISSEEIATFPSGEQGAERDLASKGRKSIRKVA